MVLVPSQPVFLGGKTRRLATFLVGQAVNEQFFNLRVRFSVPFTVSDWQLEFTLCSLRQYLQCNALGARCTVIEQDTHMGINTEFWITTNCWYWSKECDAEVINCLTLFIDVQKSDVSVLAWNVPPTVLVSLAEPVEMVEIEIPADPEPFVLPDCDLPTLDSDSVLADTPPLSKLAITDPDSWAIDLLAASWADIPPPDGSVSPYSVCDAEYDDYDDEDEDPLDLESPGLSETPESSPESSPVLSLPSLPSRFNDNWIEDLLASNRWAPSSSPVVSSSSDEFSGTESLEATPVPSERVLLGARL